MHNLKKAVTRLLNLQKYPASRSQLIAQCNELRVYSADDQKWLQKNLPVGYYLSANQVMDVLKIKPMIK